MVSHGNIKLRVPWALDDPYGPPHSGVWGALDAVNREYVQELFANASGLVFIGPDPPDDPLPGKLWWRNDPDGDLYIYYDDGSSEQWVAAVPGSGGSVAQPFLVPIGPNPPAAPQAGQLWYRTEPNPGLYMYYTDSTSSQWVQV